MNYIYAWCNMSFFTIDYISEAELHQIHSVDTYLQQECRHAVQLQQQLTSRDQERSGLRQELEGQSKELHEDKGTSVVPQDKLLKLEELELVKEDFYLERQSLEQQLAAEAEHVHQAERERQMARQEVEQAREEVKRVSAALDTEQQIRQATSKQLEAITKENQQLQVTLATERSMLDQAISNERRTRQMAFEQERLRLESQSQQQRLERDVQGLQRGLQYLRSQNEELQSELTVHSEQLNQARGSENRMRIYAAEQERLRVESQNLQQSLQQRLDAALQIHSQPAPNTVDITPWNVPRRDVTVTKEIGRGGWGTVMQGTYSGKVVAVKLPHQDLLNHRLLERLATETRLMIQVQHPNLIRIIAAVFDEDSRQLRLPPMIITELLDINLRQCYLQGRLQESSRIPVFLDVAYGLHYLHDRKEPIIHRDVSAPNVLLKALPNGMWRAKVSDFSSANLARFSVTTGDGPSYTPLQKPSLQKILTHHAFHTLQRSMCTAMASSCVR